MLMLRLAWDRLFCPEELVSGHAIIVRSFKRFNVKVYYSLVNQQNINPHDTHPCISEFMNKTHASLLNTQLRRCRNMNRMQKQIRYAVRVVGALTHVTVRRVFYGSENLVVHSSCNQSETLQPHIWAYLVASAIPNPLLPTSMALGEL